ncbi:MAG: DUF3540 domain-containing protein [Aestuariivita sp.]|nr:DUF3540 domain-containing protein [Aestuariivita sp.]
MLSQFTSNVNESEKVNEQQQQQDVYTADNDRAEGLVEHLLSARTKKTGDVARPEVVKVYSWSEERGMLENGNSASLSASCLLRPEAGDIVLTWSDGTNYWVTAVLTRANPESPAILQTSSSKMAINAKNILLTGQAVHVAAEDFLTSVKNRHAVENTRTENCQFRVSQIGTDIRRVGTADEEISGTLLQRTGTWLSTTMRDARLRARTFLFD